MVDPVGWIGQQYAEMGEEVGEITNKATSGDLEGAAEDFVVPEEDSPLDTHTDVATSVASEATAATTDGDPTTSWGEVLQWVIQNPGIVIGTLVVLYVLPTVASALEVTANLTE